MGIDRVKNGWRATARVRINGRIVERRSTVPTKAKALYKLEDLKKQLRSAATGCSLTVELKKLRDVLNIYRRKSKNAPFSEKHEYNVKRLESEYGDCELDQFPGRFERFIGLIRGQGKNHQANRYIEVARAAFGVCKSLKLIQSNPIDSDWFPETKEIARDVSLTPEQREHIIAVAESSYRTRHLAPAIRFFLQVPIRKMELVGIKIADVDLFNLAIRIRNGETKNDDGSDKPIPPDLIEWITNRVRTATDCNEPLFGRYVKGTRKNRSGEAEYWTGLGDFKSAWNTVRIKAGFPNLRVHDGRHVSCTEMIDNGTPEQVAMTVAGWRSNMLKVYYKRNPKQALKLVRFSKKPEKCEGAVKACEGELR